MRLRFLLPLAVVVVLFAATAGAQTVVLNPTQVQFDYPDFATASNFQVAYHFVAIVNNACGAVNTAEATPRFTDTVAKPTTTTGVGMTAALITKPIGCYVLKVRGLDTSGLYSIWSPASSNEGERDPQAPANTVVK
jgi:hypothetical protein